MGCSGPSSEFNEPTGVCPPVRRSKMHTFNDTTHDEITIITTDEPEVLVGVWAIINTTTGECVELVQGAQYQAMDVAGYRTKASLPARDVQDRDGATLYTCRPATTEDVVA